MKTPKDKDYWQRWRSDEAQDISPMRKVTRRGNTFRLCEPLTVSHHEIAHACTRHTCVYVYVFVQLYMYLCMQLYMYLYMYLYEPLTVSHHEIAHACTDRHSCVLSRNNQIFTEYNYQCSNVTLHTALFWTMQKKWWLCIFLCSDIYLLPFALYFSQDAIITYIPEISLKSSCPS